jgi:hypothetical protein
MAPTTQLESFRSILHIAVTLGWDLQQFDIKTTFLHSVLLEYETMFMEQPPGFTEPGKEDWVMKLMKSIYSMKQASRIWNKHSTTLCKPGALCASHMSGASTSGNLILV